MAILVNVPHLRLCVQGLAKTLTIRKRGDIRRAMAGGLMCINAGRAASSTMVFARQCGGTERDLDHAAFFA
jgi:hypothetical protein